MTCPRPFDPPPIIPTVLCGDRADFAIEAGVEPDLVPLSAVWGRMCIWCRGIALGDLSDPHCGVGFAASMFTRLMPEVGSLWADELTGLDDIAAWNLLDGLLYGYHGDVELAGDRTHKELCRDRDRWGRFDFLTNWGEQFDGYKSFVMCPPPGDTVRVLCRELMPNGGIRVDVTRAGFVAACEGFVRWFEVEQRRLQTV